ncbi:MAG: hypothetical protein APF84_01605 [Gracilibacter sp. BRH_c7a]|nr:MAG: hypothetical protein APF84_01605 [Gracilibacter sp. BRH_c7a]
MKNLKNSLLVSALSLGLFVGGAGIASAATSTDYQQRISDWINNDPIPMVMNINPGTPTAVIPTGANSIGSTTSNSNQPVLNNTQPQKPAASQAVPKPVSPSQGADSTQNPNQSDLYNQMINNCIQWDQQMMQQYANPKNRAAMQLQWQNGAQQRQNVQKSDTNWNSNYGSNGNRMSGNWSGNMGW